MNSRRCAKCGNSFSGELPHCPYCLTVVDAPAPAAPRLWLVFPLALGAVGALLAAFIALHTSPETKPPVPVGELQVPAPTGNLPAPVRTNAGPAEQVPVVYAKEDALLDVYHNLNLAAEHNDEERIRGSISKDGLAQIRKDRIEPVDFVTPDLSFDNVTAQIQEQNGDRALLVLSGSSSLVTDAQGRPAAATGLYRFEREDGRWKLRALVWHIHPPADPVPEARAWLNAAH